MCILIEIIYTNIETMRPLQLTLAILKPDIVAIPQNTTEVRNTILRNGFYFVKSKKMKLSKKDAETFYAEHEGKFFYRRLVNYMSSGPLSVHILARYDAISLWRRMMGPTKVFRTVYEAPLSIRGKYGLTDTRNSSHGSDSPETAMKEMEFFFPEFNIEQWHKQVEPYFRKGEVVFDESQLIHQVKGLRTLQIGEDMSSS